MADISKITLPSGSTYDIKDAVAREMISGGVSFIISTSAANTPDVAGGSLAPEDAQRGAFYLVASDTQLAPDYYDEYVVVGEEGSEAWEKIGDTQINLSDVVTDVTLVPSTATVIGSSSTFTITQPTIQLGTDSTSGTGKVQVVTGIGSSSASGGNVAWNSKDSVTALTGVKVTSQPTVSLTANASSATGRPKYVEDITGGSATPTTAHISGTASGGAVSASGDSVTAITGLGTPSTSSVVGGLSTAKLATSTVTGVQSSTTTASKAAAATSQTTADGTTTSHQGTAQAPQTTYNNYILGEVSVSNEVLSIKGLTLDTQTTTQHTFSDVTVPIKNSSSTTVATGSTTTSGSGATVATGASGSVNAVTGYASPTTDTVLGTASEFTVTNPTITLSTAGSTGPEVVTGVSAVTVTPTYKYLSASASGTAVGADGTDTVIGTDSTFTVTQPTITVTPSTTYLKGTASGANTAWNNKDQKTVLTNATDVNVTKGNA